MPPATLRLGPELAIELENGPHYRPGDVILGRVIRREHFVSPSATVRISLYGRSKSKMIVHRGEGGTGTYRGRYNFFGPGETCQTLFGGALHIPPAGDPKTWLFAVTIPKHPYSHLIGEGHGENSSFLSLRPQDIAAYKLPSSFYEEGYVLNTRFHGFVEYYLEAELLNGTKAVANTTLPLEVRAIATPSPISDFALRRQCFPSSVTTQRLTPGMEHADLLLRDRARKFFGTASVPRYYYSLEVDCPSKLQLDNPAPIPFRLHIIPNRGQTSEAIRDITPTATLTSLKLDIRAATLVICPGILGRHSCGDTKKHKLLTGMLIPGNGAEPIIVPSEPTAIPLDVGSRLRLRLGELVPSLHAGFQSYNLRHSHSLRWEAEVTVASETRKFAGEQPLTLLDRAADGEAPSTGITNTEGKAGEAASSTTREETGGSSSKEQLPAYSA